MKIKVTELNHDDVVNILSNALYGNHSMGCDYDSEEWDNLKDEQKTEDACFEDKCADLLLAGKSIEVADYYSEEYGLHGNKGKMENNLDEDDDYIWQNCLCNEIGIYKITLQDLIDACATEDGANYAFDFITGNDDFYSGYNLLQIAMFGEIIYG